MAKIEQLELTVQDNAIHCGGCESRIQTVLGKLPGVIKAKANHKTQQVSLALDTDKTTVAEVKERLAAAGYKAV
jgi:copper chaperone CopZ